MSDVSPTCPYVGVRGNIVLIADDLHHPKSDRICVDACDLDAFIEEIISVRDQLRAAGISTSWSET